MSHLVQYLSGTLSLQSYSDAHTADDVHWAHPDVSTQHAALCSAVVTATDLSRELPIIIDFDLLMLIVLIFLAFWVPL